MNFSSNRYFGNWAFYRRALSIALPVMAQQLIQNLVSLIDNFMVSGLGDIKMSGVNVAGMIFFMFFVMTMTICSSGGIFMSQFKGAKDKEGMQQVFYFKLLVMGILGIAMFFLCRAAPQKLFWLMVTKNTDAQAIIEQTRMYSRAVAVSFLFSGFSSAISTSLREVEIVRPPLVISVTATLINTFFNWILIYGKLGAPRLEVAGAGYATVIARICEFLMFVVYIAVKKPDFVFRFTRILKIKWSLFSKIFSKSIVILYSEIFWAASETISAGGFCHCQFDFHKHGRHNDKHRRNHGNGTWRRKTRRLPQIQKLDFIRFYCFRLWICRVRILFDIPDSRSFFEPHPGSTKNRLASCDNGFPLSSALGIFERPVCNKPRRRRHKNGCNMRYCRKRSFPWRNVASYVLYAAWTYRNVRDCKTERCS